MKFAVGDRVTITFKRGDGHWDGVKGEVSVVGSDDRYPYTVVLLEDVNNGMYKTGAVMGSWAESELVPTAELVEADIETAKALLRKHGVLFRIYTRKDVDKMLDAYAENDSDPVDTKTFREEIVESIMSGKDWKNLAQKGRDDEISLWWMVEGVRKGHPEWFVK